MNTAMHIPDGFMKNAQGHLVPEALVREQDKLRDQVVTDLAMQAIHIHEALSAFKRKALADIADTIQIAADKWEVDLGGKKGNISLTSYNGEFKVQRVYAERITFSEELEAAKELFGRCLDRWTEKADNNIRALIDRAFRPNNSGQIRTAELLGLLRLEIDDAEWQTAIEALQASINVSGSTVYVRVYKRIPDTDKYQLIPLDLASV
ncbi:MAG: sulfate transporter [Thalassobium sp.]|nr:MAG: sulfate transporter [Thalassobium sp.]